MIEEVTKVVEAINEISEKIDKLTGTISNPKELVIFNSLTLFISLLLNILLIFGIASKCVNNASEPKLDDERESRLRQRARA